MARLFISLYVFIVIALVGLSAGLDRLFFSDESKQISDVYIPLIEQANKQNIELTELLKNLGLNYKEYATGDIAWSQSNLKKLDNGEVIKLNDPVYGSQVYISLEDGSLFEIDIPEPDLDSAHFFIYSLLFFILLGGVIGLWIWPLWKDLASLQKTVARVLPDGSIAKNKIHHSSPVFPIAESLNTMGEQIKQLMQNQRELSGGVAHEFRTPLARLKFALAMKPSAQSEPWKGMRKDVNELERLVQEMLDYASTETRIPEMNLAEIPIKQLCNKLLERLGKDHLNNLQVIVLGDDVTILADEHFIERSIKNLVLNAVRYAHSKIKIQVIQGKNYIDICIEDDGPGVVENIRDKIFLPFFRPDEGRDRDRGGAGLGLAIVKRIASWHKGQCYVDTSELGGAKFVIQLPNLIKQDTKKLQQG